MTPQQEFALKQSQEYKHAHFAFVISLALMMVFFIHSCDFSQGSWSVPWGIVTSLHLIGTCIQGVLVLWLKIDLLEKGAIQKRTRILSIFQLAGLVVGNIFTSHFAFRML